MEHPANPRILVLDTRPSEVVRYAWPGGYPVFYLTQDGGILCPPCVQENIDQCCDPNDPQWLVVDHSVNWEDPHLYCDECSTLIECAYPPSLTAELFNADEWAVTDSEGGTWWPDAEAAEEIAASSDPAAAAVEMCRNDPVRGTWRD